MPLALKYKKISHLHHRTSATVCYQMSKPRRGRPSSCTPSSERCPCAGGKSSCACSHCPNSRWIGWSWRRVLTPQRGSTRCWGCGASAPPPAWTTSSAPCTAWSCQAVLSCCRRAWTRCTGHPKWDFQSGPPMPQVAMENGIERLRKENCVNTVTFVQ